MWTYAIVPRRAMPLTTLLVFTNLGMVFCGIEKAFVRKHINRLSAPMQATLSADGHVDLSKAPVISPLAVGSITPDGYYKVNSGAASCDGDNQITSEAACKTASIAIGIDVEQGYWMGQSPDVPTGCWEFRENWKVNGFRAYWNPGNFTGERPEELYPICRQSSKRNEPVSGEAFGAPVVQPKYYMMEPGTCCCPEPNEIKSDEACRDAYAEVGERSDMALWSGENPYIPGGCSAQYGSRGYMNKGTAFNSRADMSPICQHVFGPDATWNTQFYRMQHGSNATCAVAHKIASLEECQGAAEALGLKVAAKEMPWVGDTNIIPAGCSHQYAGRIHWNKGISGNPRRDMAPMCARPPMESMKYFRMPPGHKSCDGYDTITTAQECKVAAATVGFDTNVSQQVWEGISSAIPVACSGQLWGRPHFNYATSKSRWDNDPIISGGDSFASMINAGQRADIFPICKARAAPALVQQETTSFYALHAGSGGCPGNEQVRSFDECRNASQNLGFNLQFGIWAGNTSDIPGGCSAQRWSRTNWNLNENAGSRSDIIPICRGAALPRVPGL